MVLGLLTASESQVVTVIFSGISELKSPIVFVMLVHLSPALGDSLDGVTEKQFGECGDAEKSIEKVDFWYLTQDGV